MLIFYHWCIRWKNGKRTRILFVGWGEKYFDFRKVYAKLNIRYRRGIGLIVFGLYPFRKTIKKLNAGIFKKIYAVLLMEEIVREENNRGLV